jgi:hypothetical protein
LVLKVVYHYYLYQSLNFSEKLQKYFRACLFENFIVCLSIFLYGQKQHPLLKGNKNYNHFALASDHSCNGWQHTSHPSSTQKQRPSKHNQLLSFIASRSGSASRDCSHADLCPDRNDWTFSVRFFGL